MVTHNYSLFSFNFQCHLHLFPLVVALFNAIAKAKRDTVAAEEAAASSKKERSETARDDTENSSIISRERALQASKMSASNKKAAAADKDAAVEGEGGSKWAALRDDYMVGQQLTVKVRFFVIHLSRIFYLVWR